MINVFLLGDSMNYLINFIVVFMIVYLVYLFLVILRKDKLKEFKNNTFLRYLVRIYKLDIKKLDMKEMANIIALANSFIIALTYTIVIMFDGFIKQMLMAIAIFILLDLFVYHIIGIILKRIGD